MSRLSLLICLFACSARLAGLWAQEIPVNAEILFEQEAAGEELMAEDDQFLQQLEWLMKHPVNLNGPMAERLFELRLISEVQLLNLLSYRSLFGDLLDIREMQAVPGWDLVTIRRLLPYVLVGRVFRVREDLKTRISEGEHSVILRASRSFPLPKEFIPDEDGRRRYEGSPLRLFFRYRYVYKDQLQFGITGDKDAGESFFRGSNKMGFDFWSFHLFTRMPGKIKVLALGDFTVNMGQGLIHWQSMAFKKSAEAMLVKRQSPVLRPYNSAGEYNFHRGLGISIGLGRIGLTAFASRKKVSASTGSHPLFPGELTISSLLRSGYHRTMTEIGNRRNTTQLALGFSGYYLFRSLRLSINGIYHRFSRPMFGGGQPYRLFAPFGKEWANLSLEGMYNWKHTHLFGEIATDKLGRPAVLLGLLNSLNRHVDITLLYRNFDKAFQSINGYSFSENSLPSNEEGLYMGMTIRPRAGWKIDLYSDIYRFPWLRYRVSSPSWGSDRMAQLSFIPSRKLEIHSRIRSSSGMRNVSGARDQVISVPAAIHSLQWRNQLNVQINKKISLRNRAEAIFAGPQKAQGFLAFSELIYKPIGARFGFSGRIQFFETDNYDARLYAYENDVLFAQSLPASSGSGWRSYIVLQQEASKKLTLWLKMAFTRYLRKVALADIGNGDSDQAASEIRVQARFIF